MRAFPRLLCKRRGGALEISANARIITALQLLYHKIIIVPTNISCTQRLFLHCSDE